MKIRPLFFGKIEKGEIKIYDNDKFKQYVSTLEGKDIMLSVGRRRQIRSSNQNRYYRGIVIEMLANKYGYENEEMHEFCKMKFLQPRTIEIIDKNGVVDSKTIPRTTTNLDTIQFEDYLEKIRRWASMRLDFYIPLPNEFEWEDDIQIDE
jgi:hypothetical protein